LSPCWSGFAQENAFRNLIFKTNRMNHSAIIKELLKNKGVYQNLLLGTHSEQYLWKPEPGRWSLVEVVCHLHDEETEDFRSRMKHVFKTPELTLPPIDPAEWAKERNYLKADFGIMLEKFLKERLLSVEWLSDLKEPNWKEVHLHPKFGSMTPELILTNWLAHDYLHIRQIVGLKYTYLKMHSQLDLSYAGTW
jgi:hypothetical protein